MRHRLLALLTAPLLCAAPTVPPLAADRAVRMHMMTGSEKYKSEPALKARGERRPLRRRRVGDKTPKRGRDGT